jgi:hypothetical protein
MWARLAVIFTESSAAVRRPATVRRPKRRGALAAQHNAILSMRSLAAAAAAR